MNNVTTLHPNPPKIFSEESSLYFNVWERPSHFQSGLDPTCYYEDPNHKHIVRMWKDKPKSLGVVGKNYKVLHNKELMEGIEETFMDVLTPTELENVTRIDKVSHLGATCFRDYIFPKIHADIGSARSDVAFRAIVINGYDGTSSFKFYHGAIDFFCANGMVSGVYDLTVRRHTRGLQIPALTNRLRKSIDIFYKQATQWKQWVNKTISDEDAEVVYKAMPNVSERRVEQLMRRFRIECESHGRTVWALYSAATSYATVAYGDFAVKQTDSDHEASTLHNREQQVRSWLSTSEFIELAA